jgi:hypothetical protein
LDGNMHVHRAWKSITGYIKTSGKGSLGYYELTTCLINTFCIWRGKKCSVL